MDVPHNLIANNLADCDNHLRLVFCHDCPRRMQWVGHRYWLMVSQAIKRWLQLPTFGYGMNIVVTAPTMRVAVVRHQ
jgi:hypothetical protein